LSLATLAKQARAIRADAILEQKIERYALDIAQSVARHKR